METVRIRPDEWHGVITDCQGPQLVVAGPGTGKTQFLVQRAVHLLTSGTTTPDRLLVLTFSRRAAGDLSARIAAGLGGEAGGVQVSTFHSFAHRLLEASDLAGRRTLLTTPEQVRVVADLLHREDPARWPVRFRGVLTSGTFAEEVADFVLRCRERLLTTDDVRRLATAHPEWEALPDLLDAYAAELDRSARIDYGTLLAAAIAALEEQTESGEPGGVHEYVLVDEFQDTSPAQVRMLEMLAAAQGNLTVAGDPYQSIYSFRGAEVENMGAFADRFATSTGRSVRRIVLDRSFRVPAEIMRSALRVTSPGSLPGSAGPVEPADHHGRVECYVFDQQSAEAEWIAGEIERLHVEEGIRYADIAVLLRSKRRFVPELSRSLERRRIPHETPDRRLVDHPAVRLVLDLARAAELGASPEGPGSPGTDEELDRTVRRILLGPLLAAPVSLERELVRERRRSRRPWPEVIRATLPEAEDIAALLDAPGWATELPAAEGFWHAWESVAGFAALASDPERADDRAALASLAQALGRQADRDATVSLAQYLALSDRDDFEAEPLLGARVRPGAQLTLTTLHQAKGLEFEVVFIADAAEGVLPDTRRGRSLLQPERLSPDHGDSAGSVLRFRLQEEMRLAYTAMTRARRRVVWTATTAGIDEAGRRPSRFLVAASGAMSIDELGPPPAHDLRPVTALELETLLRRTAADPDQPAARRLAAVRTLAAPGSSAPWDITRFAGFARPGPDQGVVVPPIRMSPTHAEAYLACPRRYVLERQLRLRAPSSPHLTFGGLVHEVLERVERAAMEDGRGHAGVDEALTDLRTRIGEHDLGPPAVAEAWLRRGEQLLEALYRRWPADSMDPVRLEHTFRLELDGVTWVGRADRVERRSDGSLRIVDYKTSKTMMQVREAARSLQLGFYLLAARQDRTLTAIGEPSAAELWYPLSGTDTAWRRTFDPATLDDVRAALRTAAAGVLAENWTPRVSGECGRCSVRLVCDRWPEGREAFV